jgi:hypothetical protein
MSSFFSSDSNPTDDAADTATASRGPQRVSFEVPRAAALQVATWALDVAADNTDDAEDIERIGRVRRFVHSAVDGKPAKVPTEEDLLTVLAIVIAALEVDCAAPGLGRSVAVVVEELDPILDALCGRVVVPVPVPRCAGRPSLASRCRAPAIVHHRYLVP